MSALIALLIAGIRRCEFPVSSRTGSSGVPTDYRAADCRGFTLNDQRARANAELGVGLAGSNPAL
jgi:hypothetical protein